jgi:hypothetical protein
MPLNNPDIFGYYTVGGYKTYSKLEAIELHTKTGIHPSWHFNDEVFRSYDWTKEPDLSLPELYKIRAQQIREKYDYIVLFYSSGADSQNVLNTFIQNDIHLDEILSLWAKDGDGSYDTFFNREIYHDAIPQVQSILKKDPTVKHRLVDLTYIIDKLYNDKNIKFDFLYDMNGMFSPNNYARSFIRELTPEFKDIIDSGKKMCFLYGSEKPRIYKQSGKYCLKFLDLIDSVVSPRTQRLNRSWENNELFYWSPDLPQLIIKQAHLVINFLKSAKVDPIYFSDTPVYGNFGTTEIDGKIYYLTAHGVHQILYGFMNRNIYKSPSVVFSKRDFWFLKNPHHLISATNYMNGIKKLSDILPKYWLNGTIDKGIKGCISQPYWLE